MKFFEKRGIAFAALVLAIAAAVFIGQSRKAGYIEKQPSELPQVEYHQWICDDAGMLTDTTKDAIRQYNSAWDSKYYAIVAVATVDSLTGWTPEEAALQLGADWGLGANDMLLMMVRNDDYYVACGDNVLWVLSNYDTMQAKLKQAIESAYYSGDFDAAALAFYRQADVFYGQAQLGSTSADTVWTEPAQPGGVDVLGVILLIVAIFVVWMLLDAVRYRRYRRRYVTGAPVGVVRPMYYPIFWGRPRRPVRPVDTGPHRLLPWAAAPVPPADTDPPAVLAHLADPVPPGPVRRDPITAPPAAPGPVRPDPAALAPAPRAPAAVPPAAAGPPVVSAAAVAAEAVAAALAKAASAAADAEKTHFIAKNRTSQEVLFFQFSMFLPRKAATVWASLHSVSPARRP